MEQIPKILIRDTGDVIDRWAIAKLKSERIGNEESHKEYLAFCEALNYIKEKYPNVEIEMFCSLLLRIHNFLWQFEAGSKSGKERLPNPHYIYDPENKEVCATLGMINIEIKNYNGLRILVKNLINKIVGEGFQETKVNHLSE